MADIQTLILNRKKFALMPYKEYERLMIQIEDLKDLADVKKRSKEARVSIADVRAGLLKSRK